MHTKGSYHFGGEGIQVGCVQGKCLTHCTIGKQGIHCALLLYLASPHTLFFKLEFQRESFVADLDLILSTLKPPSEVTPDNRAKKVSPEHSQV